MARLSRLSVVNHPGFYFPKRIVKPVAHRAPLISSGDLQSFERAANGTTHRTAEGIRRRIQLAVFKLDTGPRDGQTGDRRPDAARRWPM
jgi:hypothetical protein